MADNMMIEVRANPNVYPAIYERTLLETLDGISMQEYQQRFKGQIKGAVDSIRFDTLIISSGVAIGATEKALFNVIPGSNTTTADGGTTYKKDKAHTNMRAVSEMEYGNVLIVESFQIEAIVGSAAATTDTANRVTDPTAVAGATLSPTLNLLSILTTSWVEWRVGDRTVLEGRAIDFPAQGGIGGFGGGVEDGVAQNGFGFPKMLREPVILRPQEQFGVFFTPQTNVTPTLDVTLVFKLSGVRLRPVG